MKNPIFAALLVLCAAPLAGQAPASTAQKTHVDPLGFSYSLPADWELVDTQPSLPAIREQADKEASNAEERKGVNCAQLPLMARRGDPPSVIEVVAMGYDCFGEKPTDKDLPDLGVGVVEGVKKSFNVVNSVSGVYTLGSHSIWIERATGNFVSQPESRREFEIVCTLLKSGLACWMAFVVDDASLTVFEQGQVVLEGDAPAALVPPDALKRTPQ